MGRRIEPGGRVTWYDRIDGETAGELGVVLGSLQRHDAARPRSRSRRCTAARSSCGSAPPRACTASSRRPAR